MSVLAVLLVLSFMVSVGFVFAFFWAVDDGQFDDTQTPALRAVLPDADEIDSSTTKKTGEPSWPNRKK
ncbi:MAG: cbb3-type cytochrome oxidase maturation protein [Rhodothermales bacterium]|jgi:cbb3-type cytochrome oxidase maturation protein